jgi:hypothetical protein
VVVAGRVRVGEVIAQVPGEQHHHQVGGRHRRRRVAGGRGGTALDGVDPQLLGRLSQAVRDALVEQG